MRPPRAPLFLARAVYRKRRLRDAARLLPILGFLLLLLPLLWGQAEGNGAGRTVVFVFCVWALLIIVAASLAPGLARPESDPTEDA
jgi:peptidoglycan/LPS O-acetylase OafA/YrhL